MMIDIDTARLQLSKGDHLRLRGAYGTRLTTISGIAWITVDRDTADTLVRAGESFLVPSDRAVLVGPLFSSVTLEVFSAPDAVRRVDRSHSPDVALVAPRRIRRWAGRPTGN